MSQLSTSRLSSDLYEALNGRKSIRVFSRGSTLFRRGTPALGIYVVDAGQVRILLPNGEGGPQLLEIDGPGSILGLSESVSGGDYRVTVEAEENVTVSFVPRDRFVEFLRDNGDYCIQVVRLLSEDLHCLYHKFRNINAHPGRPRRRDPDEQLN